MSKSKIPQHEKVIAHIKRYGKITSMDAFRKYSITRLSAVIFDLRHSGYNIVTDMVTKKGTTYAEYRLEDDDV